MMQNQTEEAKSSRAPMEQSELDSGITAKRILKTDGYSGSNPVLSRLMEEVRNEKNTTVGSRYDRVHNRHNR